MNGRLGLSRENGKKGAENVTVPDPQPPSLIDGLRWISSSRHWYLGGDIRSGLHCREPCAGANSTGSGALGPQLSVMGPQ